MNVPKRLRRSQPFVANKEKSAVTPPCRRILVVAWALTLTALMAIGASSASAKVIHKEIGSFIGADVPGGPFGTFLVSDAIDQSDGDVYVTDREGKVDKFDAAGVYAGVQIGGEGTPQGSFAFGVGSGVAVDGSAFHSGAVYVADTEHGVVDRFSAAGAFECQITGKVPGTPAEEAAECDGATGSEPASGPGIEPAGVAVDTATGDVYVADDAHAVIDEFGPAGAYLGQIADPNLTIEMGTIALDSAGNLYVTNQGANVIKFGPTGAFVSVFDANASFGVAVDPTSGRVLVAELEPATGIAEFDPSGTRLGVSPPGPETSLIIGLAVDEVSGDVYAATVPGEVLIYGPDLVVPDVITEPATGLTETSATLNGHVDPDTAHGGGPITDCHFVVSGGIGDVPCAQATPIAVAENVSAPVTLSPSTDYTYRLVAANAEGSEEGGEEAIATAGPAAISGLADHLASPHRGSLEAQVNPRGSDASCQVSYVEEADFQASGYADATTVPCAPADLGSSFTAQSASAEINGLRPATTYHYRFAAINGVGPSSAEGTFTTYGIHSFSFEDLDEAGEPETAAGGHPDRWNIDFELSGIGSANIKDAETILPPGLIGNPSATEKCTRAQLTDFECPGGAQVGQLSLLGSTANFEDEPVYNLVTPPGVPAEFGARVNTFANVYLDAHLRSGDDYGITAGSSNAPATIGINSVAVELWGLPASEAHDAQRKCPPAPGEEEERGPCGISNRELKPFLSNPTSCTGPQSVGLSVDSWQSQGEFDEASAALPGMTGCAGLEFEPTIESTPTAGTADSPTGLDFHLHIPRGGLEVPGGRAAAQLKDASVTLPKGLVINPSGANGLAACSEAEIELDGPNPASCPDAAKIGAVEIDTPLLDHPIEGGVYVARPFENKFGSLLALYIAVDDAESGTVIKLAGKVSPDPQTGQVSASFDQDPQLPFEDFHLDFFGGKTAALRTPQTCGSFETTTTMTPWSAPEGADSHPTADFQLGHGAGGTGCPASEAGLENRPAFSAGTLTPTAGAYSPFTLHLARADGSQEISSIDTTLPEGLLGKLAGITECPNAAIAQAEARTKPGDGALERRSPSCPAGSEVGSVTVGAGAGEAPYHVTGHAYLAGPYKGAPLSLEVITPAIAGPYDLGAVAVRTALDVDPFTAQIHAVSGPFPHILQGIPLDLRSIDLTLNRPDFTLNPTSCDPSTISGGATSLLGNVAPLSERFQVGGCNALKFKPQLKLSLKGSTKHAGHPALKAVLTYPKGGGYANIARAQVSLPGSEFLDQGNLNKVCKQADLKAGSCPAKSIYGKVKAWSPLLEAPLEGNVYLGVGFGYKLPALVAELNGQIRVLLVSKVDTDSRKGIRSTFEAVPDAPVERFVLEMKGGKKYGLLENSENICQKTQKAEARFTAQNGASVSIDPTIASSCGKKSKKSKSAKKKHKGAGAKK